MGLVDGSWVERDGELDRQLRSGASIRCSPMITPASGEAVVSTIVTIATASGVSGAASAVVIVPVTVLVAAEIGTATRPVATTATSATRSAAR